MGFSIPCEYGFSGIQIKYFVLKHHVSFTWELNSVHLKQLVWWLDVNYFGEDEISIGWKLDKKYFQWMAGSGCLRCKCDWYLLTHMENLKISFMEINCLLDFAK